MSYSVYPEYIFEPKGSLNLKGCFKFELRRLQGFVTDPVRIVISDPSFKKDLDIAIDPVNKIVIDDSLFRRYSCLDYPGCSNCCAINVWHIFLIGFTPNWLINELREGGAKTVSCMFRGSDSAPKCVAYSCHDHTDHAVKCRFLSETGCSVHVNNPISCMFPLVRFGVSDGTLHIGKRMYGRNWQLGCPAKFKPYDNVHQFENDTVSRFLRFKAYMDYIGIPNRVGEVIEMIRNRAERMLGGFI